MELLTCTRLTFHKRKSVNWQIECGLAWCVLLSTTIRISRGVKMLWTNEAHRSPRESTTNYDHCDDAYRCRLEYTPRWTTFDLFFYVIYKTRKTVFDHISKHRGESWEHNAQRSVLDELRGVWKCGQTLCWVIDMSYRSKLKVRRKERNKIVKIYAT